MEARRGLAHRPHSAPGRPPIARMALLAPLSRCRVPPGHPATHLVRPLEEDVSQKPVRKHTPTACAERPARNSRDSVFQQASQPYWETEKLTGAPLASTPHPQVV